MADKLLSQATKDGKINGEDIGKLTAIVREATRTVGARNIAAETMSGSDLSWGSKSVSLPQAKLAIGTYESGNNYQTQGPEVIAKDGTSRGRALGRYQVMPENLAPWLKDAGLPPMTAKEFLNSPSAQDKVFETKFGGYMEKYGSFNEATKAWFGGEGAVGKDAKDLSDGYHKGSEYLTATNRTLAQNAGMQEQLSVARAKAEKFSPDDPLIGDATDHFISTAHNIVLSAKRDDEYSNKQTIEGGIVGAKGNGKLPTTVDDLKAMGPDVEAAWQKLPNSDKNKYMNYLAKNAKGDTAWTQDNLIEYQRLKGMAQSDPAAFMDTDVVGAALPMSARKELVNLQIAKKANAEADPRVMHALQILRPTMESAQITRKGDTEGYDRFVGSLQNALEFYAQDNKKPADAKAITEIGQQLLQRVPGTGYFGSNFSSDPVYNVSVPEKHRAAIVQQVQDERGIMPTDDMIQRIYAGQVLRQLQTKGKSSDGR
jgi:hypothetical protein